jgi:hypothetical protein
LELEGGDGWGWGLHIEM